MATNHHGARIQGGIKETQHLCRDSLQHFQAFKNTGSVSPTMPDREDRWILTGHEELFIVILLLDNLAQ